MLPKSLVKLIASMPISKLDHNSISVIIKVSIEKFSDFTSLFQNENHKRQHHEALLPKKTRALRLGELFDPLILENGEQCFLFQVSLY